MRARVCVCMCMFEWALCVNLIWHPYIVILHGSSISHAYKWILWQEIMWKCAGCISLSCKMNIFEIYAKELGMWYLLAQNYFHFVINILLFFKNFFTFVWYKYFVKIWEFMPFFWWSESTSQLKERRFPYGD